MTQKPKYFKITTWKQWFIFILALLITFFLFDIIDFVFGVDSDAIIDQFIEKFF